MGREKKIGEEKARRRGGDEGMRRGDEGKRI